MKTQRHGGSLPPRPTLFPARICIRLSSGGFLFWPKHINQRRANLCLPHLSYLAIKASRSEHQGPTAALIKGWWVTVGVGLGAVKLSAQSNLDFLLPLWWGSARLAPLDAAQNLEKRSRLIGANSHACAAAIYKRPRVQCACACIPQQAMLSAGTQGLRQLYFRPSDDISLHVCNWHGFSF